MSGSGGEQGDVMVLAPDEGEHFWMPQPANGWISVRVSPAMAVLQLPFSLGTQTLPPGGVVAEHAHPAHDEVLHFVEGEGLAVVEGKEHALRPGSTVFVGRNRYHSFVNNGQSDLHWIWFIQPNGLENFFADVGIAKTKGAKPLTPFTKKSSGQVRDIIVRRPRFA